MENGQKIRKIYKDKLKTAVVYYNLLSVLNDLLLTPKQIELIAHISLNGGAFDRDEYVKEFNTTHKRMENISGPLKKKGILSGITTLTIHPALNKLDFTQPLTLNISIENETS